MTTSFDSHRLISRDIWFYYSSALLLLAIYPSDMKWNETEMIMERILKCKGVLYVFESYWNYNYFQNIANSPLLISPFILRRNQNVHNVDETSLRVRDTYLIVYSNFSILVGRTKRVSFKRGTHTQWGITLFMPK